MKIKEYWNKLWHGGFPYECPFCELEFQSMKELDEHRENSHYK